MASIKTTSSAHRARTIFSRPTPSAPTNSFSEVRAFPRKIPARPGIVIFRCLTATKCCSPECFQGRPLLDCGRHGRLYSLFSLYLLRKFCRKDVHLLDDGRFREKLWSFRH